MRLILALGLLLAQYQQYPGMYEDPRKTEPGTSKQAMPAFVGTVADLDNKRLFLETEASNTMEFNLTRKTEYYDGKTKIKANGIKTGDRVSIESRKAPDGKLDAIIVRLEKKPAKRDQ